jgi:hypothetical protein
MLELLNAHLEHWYPSYWSILFITETVFTILLWRMAVAEYKYDEQKDIEKKQRRTKTSKKTTTSASGQSVTEETSEVIEPIETKDVPNA